MDSAEVGSTTTPRRRSSACIPSCFRAPVVSDADDCGPATCAAGPRKSRRLFSWSRFQAKKKTVPVEKTVTVDTESHGDVAAGSRKSRKLFSWSRFGAKKKTVPVDTESHAQIATDLSPSKDILTQSSTENHEQPVKPTSNKKPCFFRQMSSKCVKQTTQTSPLHRMVDSAHTSTATSHPGSTSHITTISSSSSSIKSNKKCEVMELARGKLDSDAGLIVLAMTLVALLLFGRASAVVCVSVWFYLIPRLRTDRRSTVTGSSKKKLIGADSGESRKRVVMQGLLERNERRPSGSFAR